ncbi:uncharacterized protein VP01_4377g1 [Puccinia sorghi]|uniref:Retrotransposon gag domain-containing protein n=1 Tax=Puccinia sorghi TaxID=27349 RepID=A0A0L6UPR5_9BASI|nr:uncharacterized protein VP01_4377g1 [Puccinia sorghi]
MDALNSRLDKMMSFQRNLLCCGSFVGQILLHTVTYPERFPTDSSKVAFSLLFMKDYAATWSQPYLMKVFNAEEVVFNKLLDSFNFPKISLPNWNSAGVVIPKDQYTQKDLKMGKQQKYQFRFKFSAQNYPRSHP